MTHGAIICTAKYTLCTIWIKGTVEFYRTKKGYIPRVKCIKYLHVKVLKMKKWQNDLYVRKNGIKMVCIQNCSVIFRKTSSSMLLFEIGNTSFHGLAPVYEIYFKAYVVVLFFGCSIFTEFFNEYLARFTSNRPYIHLAFDWCRNLCTSSSMRRSLETTSEVVFAVSSNVS